MKTIVLAAGAAALALTAGSALAGPGKHAAKSSAAAAPTQPIPYAQLDAYLKASPRQRASHDWWSGADTGASADTSATATTSPDAAATSAQPPAATPPPIDEAAPTSSDPGIPPSKPDSTTPPESSSTLR